MGAGLFKSTSQIDSWKRGVEIALLCLVLDALLVSACYLLVLNLINSSFYNIPLYLAYIL